MSKKGRYMYVPVNIIEELEEINKTYNIHKKSDALKKMSECSKFGREVDRITKLDFFSNKKKIKRLF